MSDVCAADTAIDPLEIVHYIRSGGVSDLAVQLAAPDWPDWQQLLEAGVTLKELEDCFVLHREHEAADPDSVPTFLEKLGDTMMAYGSHIRRTLGYDPSSLNHETVVVLARQDFSPDVLQRQGLNSWDLDALYGRLMAAWERLKSVHLVILVRKLRIARNTLRTREKRTLLDLPTAA